jgi:hypothetical protein
MGRVVREVTAAGKARVVPPGMEGVTVIPMERAEQVPVRILGKVKGKEAGPGKAKGAGLDKELGREPEKGKVPVKDKEKAPVRFKALTVRKTARVRMTPRKIKAAERATARVGKGKGRDKGRALAQVKTAAVQADRAGVMMITPAVAEPVKVGRPSPVKRRQQLANLPRNRQSRHTSRRSRKRPNNLKV